jgi:phosphocarrier protein
MLPENWPASIQKTAFCRQIAKKLAKPASPSQNAPLFYRMSTRKKNDSTVSREMVVQNQLGLHARPASMFVKMATRFQCDILVEKEGEEVNGKSIMGLMMLAAAHGTKLTVTAEGSDAAEAVNDLEQLVNRNFEEE